MSRRTLGILAGVVGSAIGTWWLTTQRRSAMTAPRRPARDHGTVIFDNHATVSPDAEGII